MSGWLQQIIDMCPPPPKLIGPHPVEKSPPAAPPPSQPPPSPKGADGGAGGRQGQVRPFDNTTPVAPTVGADGGAGGRQGQVRPFGDATPRAPTVGADGGAGGNGGQQGQVRPFGDATPRAPMVGADGGAGGRQGQVRAFDNTTPRAPTAGADGGAGGNGGQQGQVRPFGDTTPRAPTVGADGGAGGYGQSGAALVDDPQHQPRINGPGSKPQLEQDKYDLGATIPNHPEVLLPGDPDTAQNSLTFPDGGRPIPTGTAVGPDGKQYGFFSDAHGDTYASPQSTVVDLANPSQSIGVLQDSSGTSIGQASGVYDPATNTMWVVGNVNGTGARGMWQSTPINKGNPNGWVSTLQPRGTFATDSAMNGNRENQIVALPQGGFLLTGRNLSTSMRHRRAVFTEWPPRCRLVC
jgi:hypothetical protein